MNKKQEEYLLGMNKNVNQLVAHLSMCYTWDVNPPVDDLTEEAIRLCRNIFDQWKDVDKIE